MGSWQRYRNRISCLLLAVALICASLVFWRAFHGEFRSPLVGVRSPMNLEGVCALALLSLAFLRSERESQTQEQKGGDRLFILGLAALAILAFVPFLRFPFLADDYEHIWNARHLNLQSAIAHFTQPEPDRFFRPLVYLFYGAEAFFAGLDPTVWRGVSLVWHITASILVYALLRKLTPLRFGAFAGAALFAVHGTRPEAVTWIAARFDLMATTLGLAALYLLLWRRDLAAAVFLLMALLCKEAAFVFPLLALLLLWFARETWQECLRRTAPWFAIASVVFLYRLALLGEIGGYHNLGNGRPTIFNLKLTTTLKGFFVRSWASILVPVNWSYSIGFALAFLLAAAVIALAWLAWKGGDRRLLITGVAFFCLAALPVHQFLSIGDDLEKSRVLYLPSVGVAILFAGLIGVRLSPGRALAAIAALAFQFAALQHNLQVWRSVGVLASRTCSQVVAEVDRSSQHVSVPGLPNIVDGVYFLKTGFPACVWLERPDEAGQAGIATTPGGLNLRWDEASRSLVPDVPKL